MGDPKTVVSMLPDLRESFQQQRRKPMQPKKVALMQPFHPAPLLLKI